MKLDKYSFIFYSILILIILITVFSQNFNEINLGGDGTRISLIFPQEILNNLSLNFYSLDNHQIFTNQIGSTFQNIKNILLQKFFGDKVNLLIDYPLVGLSSYIGMYLILKDVYDKKNLFLYLLPLFYSLSPSWAWGVYYNGGPWIYVFAFLPLCLRSFILFTMNGNKIYLLFGLFILFTYSEVTSIRNIPWILPLFMSIILIYLPQLIKVKKEILLKNFTLLIIILIITHLHLIISIYLNFFSNYSINLFSEEQSRRVFEFKNILKSQNNYFEYFFFSTPFGETLKTISSFFLNLLHITLSFLILVIIILIFNNKISFSNEIKYYIFITLFFYFLTNIGIFNFNKKLFIYLIDYFPLLHGFKSNVKFLSSFNVLYITLIYVVLINLNLHSKKYVNFLGLLTTIIILLPTIFWLNSEKKSYPYYDNSNYDNYDQSYIDILKEIKNKESTIHNGNIFILPMTYEYEIIFNDQRNKIYAGPNFSSTLTGTKSFTGLYYNDKFNKRLNLNNNLFNDFEEYISGRKIDQLSKLIKDFKISYVIINNSKNINDKAFYLRDASFFINYKDEIINTLKAIGFNDSSKSNEYYSLLIKERNYDCVNIRILRSSILNFLNDCQNNEENMKFFIERFFIENNLKINEWIEIKKIDFISDIIMIINPFSIDMEPDSKRTFFIHKGQFMQDISILISLIFFFITSSILLVKYFIEKN